MSGRKKSRTSRIGRAAVIAGTVGIALAGAPAHADTGNRGAVPGKHCVIVLEKGGGVKSAQCAENRAGLREVAPQSTLLMTIYDGANWSGSSAQIRGDGGACDAQGYGVPDLNKWVGADWNNYTSSFRTFNGCNTVNAHTNTNYGGQWSHHKGPGTFGISVGVLPANTNNNVESFWLWRL